MTETDALDCRLTGDHITTAKAIAEAVEILPPNAPKSMVMTVRPPLLPPCYPHSHTLRQRNSTNSPTTRLMRSLSSPSSSPAAPPKPKSA